MLKMMENSGKCRPILTAMVIVYRKQVLIRYHIGYTSKSKQLCRKSIYIYIKQLYCDTMETMHPNTASLQLSLILIEQHVRVMTN